MNTRLIGLILILALALSLFAGCTVTAEIPAASQVPEADTTIRLSGSNVTITGTGAYLDNGQIVIRKAGAYTLYGASDNCRIMVKADPADDVTLILAGLELTNPDDEAIYFKTCGSARVILKEGTENLLSSGSEPDPAEAEIVAENTAEEERAEEDTASGAVLRALCAMTVEGAGALTVNGWINNGIAADGGLTIAGGVLDVTAVNDGLKSDTSVSITGGVIAVQTDCDGVQSGGTLDISGGSIAIVTGAASAGAEMKISDSLMMGAGGGGMRGGRGSQEMTASGEASGETTEDTETIETTEATEETSTEMAETPALAEETAVVAADTTPDAAADNSASQEMASREMQMPGDMDDRMDRWDTDSTDTPSRKGLKAASAITISGGTITVDAEDDAIHSDGSVTITGGQLTLSSGDDGIHGETTLDISGSSMDILMCYEGLEASAIYISGGYMNIIATNDGMNASGGSSGEMMGPGMRPGSSGEASGETDESTEAADAAETAASTEATSTADTAATEEASAEASTAAEADTAASDDASATVAATGSESETVETIVRITGGVILVDSGGDGLDSNASMYIEGGTIFVSGPSTNWDSPIDYGEGSSELVISGGRLMAAGYSGMFESPDTTDSSQSSIYYIQSAYAPDGGVVKLTAEDGTVLAEYAFAHSFNGVLISTPDMAAGETYTLTIDGVDTPIEMTTAYYSNRSGSGEMGGPGGRQ